MVKKNMKRSLRKIMLKVMTNLIGLELLLITILLCTNHLKSNSSRLWYLDIVENLMKPSGLKILICHLSMGSCLRKLNMNHSERILNNKTKMPL